MVSISFVCLIGFCFLAFIVILVCLVYVPKVHRDERKNSLDIIKENTSVFTQEYPNRLKHRQKAAEFRGELSYRADISGLVKAGFNCLVERRFVLAFTYAAILSAPRFREFGWSAVIDQSKYWPDIGNALWYRGDIPDILLDRCKRARDLGVNIFTVHSQLKLNDTNTDLAVVGWLNNPQIQCNGNFLSNMKVKNCWNEDCLGVLIGVCRSGGMIKLRGANATQ